MPVKLDRQGLPPSKRSNPRAVARLVKSRMRSGIVVVVAAYSMNHERIARALHEIYGKYGAYRHDLRCYSLFNGSVIWLIEPDQIKNMALDVLVIDQNINDPALKWEEKIHVRKSLGSISG